MNRYLQKVLEIKFHFLANQIYKLKHPYILNKTEIESFKQNPLVSIVVPIYKPDPLWLQQCIESVLSQTYFNWELILIDDNSSDPKLTKVLNSFADNPKIKVIVNPDNLNIAKTTNIGIQNSRGEWIGFLDHDDTIWPSALSEVVKAINNHPNIKLIYTDQDKIDDTGRHFDPFLKKDFDYDLLRQTNYFNHFTLIDKDLLLKLNNLRLCTDLAQDWDLVLRATNILQETEVYHLPKILYSWRVSSHSTASSQGIKSAQDKIAKKQQEVLEFDLKSRSSKSCIAQTRYLGIWSTDNQPTILPFQFHLHSLLQLLFLGHK